MDTNIQNYIIFLQNAFGIETTPQVVNRKIKKINEFIDFILSEDQAENLKKVFRLNSEAKATFQESSPGLTFSRKKRALEILGTTINKWRMLDLLEIVDFETSSAQAENEKIDNFGFKVRSKFQMMGRGIQTIGDLLSKTEEELQEPFGEYQKRRLSNISLNEIKDILNEIGLQLKNQIKKEKKNMKSPKERLDKLEEEIEALKKEIQMLKRKR